MTFFVKKCTTFAMKISAIQEKCDLIYKMTHY